MGDRFKKTQAGQPLEVSAEVWNAYIDAVRAEKGKKHDLRAEELSQVRQGDIIKVRNASGEDRLRFHVLGIKTPIITPGANLREFKNQVSFDGVRPKHPEHYGRFMILLDPMRIGKIGRAWVSGVCPAYITVEDECHQCCDVKHDDPTILKSCPKGSARILWREGGTGEQWAVVRLSNVFEEFRRFILLAPLARCGSAQAQRVVYSGGKWCDSDCPFTVYDSLGVVCPEVCKCGSGGQEGSGCGCCNAASVPAGTFGWAKWMHDSEKWELVALGEGCCKSGGSGGSGSSGSGSGSGSYGTGSGSGSGSYGSGTGSGTGTGTAGTGSGAGGLTITRKVLIPCPRREGDYVVFPSEIHTYVDGRLTNVEPSGEECRVYICCCSCGSGSGTGTGTGTGSGTGSGSGSGSYGSGSGTNGTGSGSTEGSGSGSDGSGSKGSGGSDGSDGSGGSGDSGGSGGSGGSGDGSGSGSGSG